MTLNSAIIAELEKLVCSADPDIRWMYRVRGNKAIIPSEHQKTVESIFGSFDDNIRRGMNSDALEDMQKLLGLLEGIADGEESVPSQATNFLEPTFSLGKKDKERVIELCSKIRKIIFATTEFDQPHKRLLLDRIAAIEYQVEQPKGKLDVLRAGVSEVGETLGKFGTDIDPLTKRVKEIFQIGRSNSDEYAQIPAPEDIKQLPKPDEEES